MTKFETPNLVPTGQQSGVRCPDCFLPMRPYRCEDVIVDKCLNCNGIWFDSGEFNIFKDSLSKFDLQQIDIISHAEESETEIISGCPRCDQPLFEIKYSYNTKIKIKRCETCRGIWLPLPQTIRLIELAKMSQAVAPDLKGILRESKKYFEQEKQAKELRDLGKAMGQPASRFQLFLASRGYYFFSFVPFYDNNPRSKFPFITCLLIAMNCLIYILMAWSDVPLSEIYRGYALVPSDAADGKSLFTFVSSIFMHGGTFHLLANMFFLWTFGDNVEEFLGSIGFLIFYLICGLSADIIHIFTNPHSTIPSLGASGAIAGILGSYFVLFPSATIKTVVLGSLVNIPAWIYLGAWFGLQLLWGSIYFGSDVGGVAWWAHIGGFASGLFITIVGQKLGLVRKRREVFSG